MANLRYPEWWKRERMLWFIHEWMQENQTDEKPVPALTADTVQRWGESQEGLNGAQALHLFKELVEEGYIALIEPLDTRGGRSSWFMSCPQALTEKGLIAIGEMPNPKERLIQGLEAALRNIERDPTLGPEEKQEKLNLGREAVEFIRGLAVEVAAKILVGG